MNWHKLWVSLGLLCICGLHMTQQCSPPKGWRSMQPYERAKRARIVVFGTVISSPHIQRNSEVEGRFYTVILKVHCIIKGPKLPQFINVSGFSDFSGGLCVHSKVFLNKSYVIFMENDDDNPGGFQVVEVNVQKGAIHPGHRFSVLKEVMFAVAQNASMPNGDHRSSKLGCPAKTGEIYRDPAPNKRKQTKTCRCRRKKQKRKKKKRFRGTSLPRNKVRWEFFTGEPTIPRTRRYNVLNLERDKAEKQVPHSAKAVAFSNSASHQSIIHRCLVLLTFHSLVVFMLLPT